MRILLDTHVWLWALAAPDRLGRAALDRLSDESNELYLSAASTWEIAIKAGLGRIKLPEPTSAFLAGQLARAGLRQLPVEHSHCLELIALPLHHRDPFDRMLIAQAMVEGLTIMTTDRDFAKYRVPINWATASRRRRRARE